MEETEMTEDIVEEAASQEQENLHQPLPTEEELEHDAGVITVVLTADNHLGYTTFGQRPRKREEREQQLRRAFQQATDFAIGQSVDLFIQAGDLFDTVNPDERDRSFVAARLVQLRQAGVRTFAVGGTHDTPPADQALLDDASPAPQISYARLGALHYFAPYPDAGAAEDSEVAHDAQLEPGRARELEAVLFDVSGVRVGICGLSALSDQEDDPLARVSAPDAIGRADISILILHAPIEGLTSGAPLLDTRAQVSRASISNQAAFRYILAGSQHSFRQTHIGQCDVVVAGATQHINFSDPDDAPGFVYLGLAADGIRWCQHVAVDSLHLRRLVLPTTALWPAAPGTAEGEGASQAPMEIILERLRPLCSADAMVQLRLEGELTRGQYHQLDLNQIRHYGEQHCFALAIDDSALSLLSEQEATSAETGERFSPRAELITLADEWIAAADDEQEKKALRTTKEVLLAALDEIRIKR